MKTKDGKAFFMAYNGFYSYMERMDLEKFKQYDKKRSFKRKEEKWRYELLDQYYDKIFTMYQYDDIWMKVETYIEIIQKIEKHHYKYYTKMLDVLYYSLTFMDIESRIIILEDLVGKTKSIYDTPLTNCLEILRLRRRAIFIFNELINFNINDLENDYDDYIDRYYQAIEKMKKERFKFYKKM